MIGPFLWGKYSVTPDVISSVALASSSDSQAAKCLDLANSHSSLADEECEKECLDSLWGVEDSCDRKNPGLPTYPGHFDYAWDS